MTVLASVAPSLHCSLSSGLTFSVLWGGGVFFEIRNSLCLYALCGTNRRNPTEVSLHTKKEDWISEREAATVFLRVQVIATCIISLFKALRLMLFLPILTCLTTLFALQNAAKNANCWLALNNFFWGSREQIQCIYSTTSPGDKTPWRGCSAFLLAVRSVGLHLGDCGGICL